MVLPTFRLLPVSLCHFRVMNSPRISHFPLMAARATPFPPVFTERPFPIYRLEAHVLLDIPGALSAPAVRDLDQAILTHHMALDIVDPPLSVA